MEGDWEDGRGGRWKGDEGNKGDGGEKEDGK